MILSVLPLDQVRSIITEKEQKLKSCWIFLSKRRSWFFMVTSVVLNVMMANWRTALICLEIFFCSSLLTGFWC